MVFDRRKEYGFKLQVPAGALHNKEGCVVRVRACLPKAVPVGLDLVSAIYELSTPGSDQHPLGPVNIEIEQCALVEGEDELQQLCFLLCKAESNSLSPLHFSPIKGNSGEFSQHSAYGKLTLTSFSYIAIAMKWISSWFSWSTPVMYCARVYIENYSLMKKAFCFVLMRALEVDVEAVEKIYSSSKELSKIPEICFTQESDSITLHWSAPEGWIISSAYDPAEVKRKLADRFNRRNPAECKFFAEPQSPESKSVHFRITLNGVERPTQITVPLSFSTDTSISATESPAVGSFHDQPTLGPEHLDQLFPLVKSASEKWAAIGTELGFKIKDMGEIRRTDTLHEDTQYFEELIKRWLNQAPPDHSFPHLNKLVTALREVGMERTAYELENKLSSVLKLD